MVDMHNELRLLPSIDVLLQSSQGQEFVKLYTHTITLNALRLVLGEARRNIRGGARCPSSEVLLEVVAQNLRRAQQPQLRRLINATGVIINTNLGRAPLSLEALQAVQQVANGYTNLEYDLEAGERGSRHVHVAQLLRELTGAEATLVTNNNAAAVLLSLSALALGREVVISRGQLVEIGGGFRVPDVMRQSGCQLVEVGTTNRTRIRDYEEALSERTALLLSVHPSNFLITGFTESTREQELVALAQKHGLLVMHDLGSGCLLNSEQYGLTHEPTPQESIQAGVDLACFSGDKLLGGPQAGIIVGKQAVISRLAKHPLMRALRIDKMTLAALETTLRHYQRGEAEQKIPVWQMIGASQDDLKQRAHTWVGRLNAQGIEARVQPGESTIGGGSLPGETLPTWLLALPADQIKVPLSEYSRRLRAHAVPVVTRIFRDTLLLDPRTVFPEQDEELLKSLLVEIN